MSFSSFKKAACVVGLLFFFGCFVVGAVFVFRERTEKEAPIEVIRGLPTIHFYTAPTATTPQLPFWAAYVKGELADCFQVKWHLWKDLDALSGILLAGKGDLWLGHLEGFARAKSRGAPLVLLAVTGWRKFYLLSRDEQVQRIEDFLGKQLPVTPVGSPAIPLVKASLGEQSGKISFVSLPPQQLMLMLKSGRADSAIAPEPLVSMLLEAVQGLRVVESVEQRYAQVHGGPSRLPLVGIAANSRLVQQFPACVERLTEAMIKEGSLISENPGAYLGVMPEEFSEFIPKETVANSLSRDIVLVKRSGDVQDEIIDFLRVVAPETVGGEGAVQEGASFFWRGR